MARPRGFPTLAFLLVSIVCLVPSDAARLLPFDVAKQQVKASYIDSAVHFSLPNGVIGAESLAFDSNDQGPYTGVSDGRILKWRGASLGWTTFAYNEDYRRNSVCKTASSDETESLCGRPLGLAFYRRTGDLYIADAYKGLMRVGPRGGKTEILATEAGGVPFNFVNGVDVDQATGDVYFTDSSTTYTRRSNINIMYTCDATARLMKYDAQTKQVTVLMTGLPYANGVAVSHDGTYVVVAHTWPSQVFRYGIKGPNAGQYKLFADLPGYPDNIRRNIGEGYWVALNREKVPGKTCPVKQQAKENVQLDSTNSPVKHLIGVRLNNDGIEVEELATTTQNVTLSEVSARRNELWLGSVQLKSIGVMKS
uniref:Strictosidine synthase conserved region domain-containing protein n=1 Tax=Leersia perrieri TaxID=77586 RepID=A0A0D9XFB7_9ORYZ